MINNNHNKYIYMIYFLKIPKQSPLDPNVFWKASDHSWPIYTRMRDLPWFAPNSWPLWFGFGVVEFVPFFEVNIGQLNNTEVISDETKCIC